MSLFEFSCIKDGNPFSVGNLKTFEDVLEVANMAKSAGFTGMTVTKESYDKEPSVMSLEDATKKYSRKVIDGTVPSEVIYTKDGRLRPEVRGYMNSTGASL